MQTRHQFSRYVRLVVIAVLLGLFVLVADFWIRGELRKVEDVLSRARAQVGPGVLIGGGLVYIILLSIPFVPGVELGLLLMCLFGRPGIVFVYCSTICGLMLAFAVGRWLPKRYLLGWLQRLGIAGNEGQDDPQWIETALAHSKLGRKLQRRFGATLLRYRYVMLAILLNLPGNSVIGGGGGIALACGVSRLFHWKGFFLTIILVTAPVPLLAFFGLIQLEALFL